MSRGRIGEDCSATSILARRWRKPRAGGGPVSAERSSRTGVSRVSQGCNHHCGGVLTTEHALGRTSSLTDVFTAVAEMEIERGTGVLGVSRGHLILSVRSLPLSPRTRRVAGIVLRNRRPWLLRSAVGGEGCPRG